MTTLATTPRVRSVDPTAYLPLRDFSCGGTVAYEREVDEIARMLCRGEVAFEAVRVAEDAETGRLIGLCVVARRDIDEVTDDAAYIALIGVDARWRGRRLPDGTRIGVFLVGDALREIARIWRAPPMPAVWSLVAPENLASHRIFTHWEFGRVPHQGAGYDVRFRPPEPGPARRRS